MNLTIAPPNRPDVISRPVYRSHLDQAKTLVGKQVVIETRSSMRCSPIPVRVLAVLFDGTEWRLVTDYRNSNANWSPRLGVIDSVEVRPQPTIVKFV